MLRTADTVRGNLWHSRCYECRKEASRLRTQRWRRKKAWEKRIMEMGK